MFIAVPVGMNYRTERLPVVTFSLIGINTLVYLVSLFFLFTTDGQSELWILQHLWLTPSHHVLFEYLTSMFVHAGILHLVGNMLFLFLFGCCVEDLIGRWRFLLFYLLGGLAAALVFIATDREHFADTFPMGGASGAISACMGMYLMLRTEEKIEFKYFWMFGFRFNAGEFEVPAWMAVGFWFLKDLLWLVLGMLYPFFNGTVAVGAHVGGLLAGAGFIALSKLSAKRRAGEITNTGILSPEEIKAAALGHASPSFEVPTIYLHENGSQTGPYTLSHIQSRLAKNEVSAGTLYWSEGMGAWENVKDLADTSRP